MAKMATGYVAMVLALLFCVSSAEQPKYPVILVPGDGGSQLYAKLDRSEVPHFYCAKKTADYFNIWLNLEEFSLPIECFVDNMRLRYNSTTHTSHNADGVDIRIQNFGDTKTVEWLDPDDYIHHISARVAYFYNIVEALVANNYTRNKDIKGAPYDFRRAPSTMTKTRSPYVVPKLDDARESSRALVDDKESETAADQRARNKLTS